MLYKDYIGQQFLNKRVRVWCDCIVKFDIKGTVLKYEVVSNEVIYTISIEGSKKTARVGENTPNLNIELL